MSGEEGEEPRPANIYIHGLISIVREGDQRAGWLECGKLGLGEGDNVESLSLSLSLSHTHTHTHTHSYLPVQMCRAKGWGRVLLEDLVGYAHSDHHLLKPWVTECVRQSEGAALPHSKRTQRALVPLAPDTSEKMAPNVVGDTTVGLHTTRGGGSRGQGTVGASSGGPQVGEEGAGGCHVLIAPGTRDTSSQDPHSKWVGSAGPGEQVGAKPHSDGCSRGLARWEFCVMDTSISAFFL